jgi:3' exoribonuclease, RNase T-like
LAEVYVSTDVEVDGPAPGIHSLLSFGSAAFLEDGTCVGTFTANLETLPGSTPDPATVAWWAQHPEAFRACRADPRPPAEVMDRYVAWLEGLPHRPVFVGFPAGFDFTFIYWYLMRFVGRSPFSHYAIDIRTFAMATLGCEYYQCTKTQYVALGLLRPQPHTHHALEDALVQGELFCNLLAARRSRREGMGET